MWLLLIISSVELALYVLNCTGHLRVLQKSKFTILIDLLANVQSPIIQISSLIMCAWGIPATEFPQSKSGSLNMTPAFNSAKSPHLPASTPSATFTPSTSTSKFNPTYSLNDIGVSIALLRKTSELRDTSDEQNFQDISQNTESDQKRRKFLTLPRV